MKATGLCTVLFGVKPKEHVVVDKYVSFPASLFIVTSPEPRINQMVAELQGFADQCGVKPWLQMIVSGVLQVM